MSNSRSALFLGIFALLAVGFLMTACGGGIDCDEFCGKATACMLEGGATGAEATAFEAACNLGCDSELATDEEEDCADSCMDKPCAEFAACLIACGLDLDDID